MQSEDFDKRIKEAADHHYPAYREEAWTKMKDLLDKHMPEEEKRRRRGWWFFLLFGLLTGSAIWLMVTKPWNEHVPQANSEKAGTEETVSPLKTTPGGTQVTPPVKETPAENNDRKDLKLSQTEPPSGEINFQNDGYSEPGKPNKKFVFQERKSPRRGEEIVSPPRQTEILVQKDNIVQVTPQKDESKEQRDNPAIEVQPVPPSKPADQQKPATEITKKDSTLFVKQPSQETRTDSVEKAVAAAGIKKSGKNSFSISVSAGPDISSVGLNDVGKVRPVFGAGIGYTIKDRVTIRTGFYTAQKIYTAEAKDYKPSWTPPNVNYLYEVDADCRVYEIPLIVSYHFGKKRNWFGAAGVSSLLMKRETYDYLYKYPNGATYEHRYEYENENKHFFSTLHLSGGYNRKLSEKFSLSAEPYIKLPLSGIGVGNIKLNSAGVLFSLQMKIK